MQLSEAVKQSQEYIRRMIAEADGSEEEVYAAFADAIGSDVYGWEMRLQELREEE